MADRSQLMTDVKAILLRDWDPIGVRDVPQASDEYDTYAAPLAGMIAARASGSALAKHLLDIETGAMGLPGNRDRALSVAEKLQMRDPGFYLNRSQAIDRAMMGS